MRIIFVFVLGLLFSVSGHAHDPLDLATPEEKAAALATVEEYLSGAFVAVRKVDEANSRDFEFVGTNGEHFYVERSDLAQALVSLASAMARKNPVAGEEPTPRDKRHWLIRTFQFVARIPVNTAVFLYKLPRRTFDFVRDLPRTTVRLSGAATELANQHGLLPTLLVIASWPPYTGLTEFLESLVMGPAHIFCHASQVAYFSTLGFFLMQGQIAADVVRTRGTTTGVWGRLKQVFAARDREKQFRKGVQKIFLENLPAVVNQRDFDAHLMASHDVISETLADTVFWADLYQATRETKTAQPRGETEQGKVPRDVTFLFSDAPVDNRLMRAFEMVSALRFFTDLVRKKFQLNYELGKIPALKFISHKAPLGRFVGDLEVFRRALWLAVQEKEAGPLKINEAWATSTYRQLLRSLETLSDFDSTPGQIRLRQIQLDDVLYQFRSGKIPVVPCPVEFLAEAS